MIAFHKYLAMVGIQGLLSYFYVTDNTPEIQRRNTLRGPRAMKYENYSMISSFDCEVRDPCTNTPTTELHGTSRPVA